MSRARVLRSLAVGALTTLAACGDRDASRGGDTAGDTTLPGAAAGPDPWVDELGRLLVIPMDSPGAAIVLVPRARADTALDDAITLLAASGDSAAARATPVPDAAACGDAAIVRLAGAPAAWSVGVQARGAIPLSTDSLAGLSARDSTRRVADVARLASTVRDTGATRFSGLPFVVLSARGFDARGVRTVLAHVVRRLPQEASPMEEHTFLIAERAVDDPAASLALVYHDRSSSAEDTAEHFEVLAALLGARTTVVILARDRVSQTTYELLERSADGAWRRRWSRELSC